MFSDTPMYASPFGSLATAHEGLAFTTREESVNSAVVSSVAAVWPWRAMSGVNDELKQLQEQKRKAQAMQKKAQDKKKQPMPSLEPYEGRTPPRTPRGESWSRTPPSTDAKQRSPSKVQADRERKRKEHEQAEMDKMRKQLADYNAVSNVDKWPTW